MENSMGVKLKHSMVICAKISAFPVDIRNRSFCFFMDTIDDNSRCSDEELTIIGTGVAAIAHHGTAIAEIVAPLVKVAVLPKPGEVAIIGIAGDEIPVVKPQGTDLTPYTLWGEIAFQIGGSKLYESVATEASSHAAPSRNFLDRILGGRKAIIMLDELAQYATRLEAARPDGAAQLAAFLMSLHGYARTSPGVSILFTLAARMMPSPSRPSSSPSSSAP